MHFNLRFNVFEDMASCYFAFVENLFHLAVDQVPRPADVFTQETAQWANQIREVFDIASADVLCPFGRMASAQFFSGATPFCRRDTFIRYSSAYHFNLFRSIRGNAAQSKG